MPFMLQLMAGAERLCHILEFDRELMSYFRMESQNEKGWDPLVQTFAFSFVSK